MPVEKFSNSQDPTALAWHEAAEFAAAVAEMKIPDLQAIFCIGSLPGNYFRPGQSDLDIVVLLSGNLPTSEKEQKRHNDLAETLKALTSQSEPYEMEALIRYTPEIVRDPNSGILPNPDLTARLYLQSVLLHGEFDYAALELPNGREFRQDAQKYLDQWRETWQGRFFEEATPAQMVKHALTLIRLYLACCRGIIAYDKTRLVQIYQSNNPERVLPPDAAAYLQAAVAGQDVSDVQTAQFREQLSAFHQVLLEAIFQD